MTFRSRDFVIRGGAALATLLASTAATTVGDKFLRAAEKYVIDKDGIAELYVEHVKAKYDKYGKPSELEEILLDMTAYVKENEDSSAPKHILTVLTGKKISVLFVLYFLFIWHYFPLIPIKLSTTAFIR